MIKLSVDTNFSMNSNITVIIWRNSILHF